MADFRRLTSPISSFLAGGQSILLITVVLGACYFVGNVAASGEPGNLENGKTVYQTFCTPCHGTKGKGDGPAGKFLTPPPANLTGKSTKVKSEKELLNIVQNGKPGTAMPPWKQSFSPQQTQDVVAYIRSLN